MLEKELNALEYGYTEEENAVYSTDTADMVIILPAVFLTVVRFSFSSSEHWNQSFMSCFLEHKWWKLYPTCHTKLLGTPCSVSLMFPYWLHFSILMNFFSEA